MFLKIKFLAVLIITITFMTCKLGEPFQPPSYVIVYNSNGGSGQMENSDHVYGTEKNLNANAFTRTGYSFAGWAQSPSDTAVFTDGQSVINLANEAGAAITLYAQWNANTYTVVYNANGGSGDMEDSGFRYDEAQTLKPNAFTNVPHVFSGWALSASGPIEFADQGSAINLTAIDGDSFTLYARWGVYTVTFDINDGIGTVPVQQMVDAGSSITLPGGDGLSRSGYTFGGWNTDADGTGTNFNAGDLYTPTDSVTLFAKWNPIPIDNASTPILTVGNAQIFVSWEAITGADQYELFFGTGENPPLIPAQTINAPATSATITGLTNGTSYNVWVRGKNASGTGAVSNPAAAKPIGSMGAVTLNAETGQLSLGWASVAGADEYEVYFNTSGTMPESPAQTVSATTATIGGLINGTRYFVWVRGKNPNGKGNVSTVVNAIPIGTPGAPTLTPGFNQLLVSWTAVPGADEYEVYYGIDSATTLWTTTAGTSATITGLATETTYQVRLRTRNSSGVSDFGTSASGTTIGMVSVPNTGDFIVIASNPAGISFISPNLIITQSGTYNITGTGSQTTHRIRVIGGVNMTADIIFRHVNIDVSSTVGATAFDTNVNDDAGIIVNLTLQGTNNLNSGRGSAGLRVPSNGVVTITGEGTLNAVGGEGGAGIGGSGGENSGTINILGANITATGGLSAPTMGGMPAFAGAAGIGGGGRSASSGADNGIINIVNSAIIATATDFSGGSGIGGGSGGNLGTGGNAGTINIEDSTVTATGASSGAMGPSNVPTGSGIGGGGSNSYSGFIGGDGGLISIKNSTVTATNVGSLLNSGIGAGIGGSGIGASGILDVSDNAVVFASSIWQTLIENDNVNNAIVFISNNGTLYGNVTLWQDVTFDAGQILTIPTGRSLNVPVFGRLTNNGTINNSGSIINRHNITGSGEINDN